MSSDNVGLPTPRGSGTSGYVQSKRFFAKPATTYSSSSPTKPDEIKKPKMSKDIAEHQRKRNIHLQLLLLSETLADQGYTESEIVARVEDARKTLEADSAAQPNKRFRSLSFFENVLLRRRRRKRRNQHDLWIVDCAQFYQGKCF